MDQDDEAAVGPGDPLRSLVRYRSDGSELYVHCRINLDLFREATTLPVLLLKPESRDDEIMTIDALLNGKGSRRNYALLERLCEDIAAAGVAACYLAEQHGERRRDFYFVAEDGATFERTARATATALGFPLTIEQHTLTNVAPIILPREAIGELGLTLAPVDVVQRTRFEFWGDQPALHELRLELERRGYRFLALDPVMGELRVVKDLPVEGPAFLGELREVLPLAHGLGCRYRGKETMDGTPSSGFRSHSLRATHRLRASRSEGGDRSSAEIADGWLEHPSLWPLP